MLGDPRSGSEVWEVLDRDIGKSGENRCQIVTHGDFQPSAAFHDRKDRRDLRSRVRTADVYPVLSTQCHGTHRLMVPPENRYEIMISRPK